MKQFRLALTIQTTKYDDKLSPVRSGL